MRPQQDPQDTPAAPRPEAGEEQATRYDTAQPGDVVPSSPPADAAATDDGAAPPPFLDTGATRYAEPPTDSGRTNYQTLAAAGDPDATRYPAAADDLHATGYPPTAGTAEAPSGTRLPRCFAGYELFEEIGRGGMGVVYKARQLQPDRLVALKMIRAGELATKEDVRRFRLEANEAARLDHPHVVPVYEVGEHWGRHFFTMRLLEGSLAERLDHYQQDRKAAARLLVAVARAVHHAHQRQLLHRDLKPGNVLLDAEGQPYVADFGLAKRLGGAGDASQSAGGGTPAYMAPEQARGEARLTTAVDVYGLGGILYALLTGRPPFKGGSHWETIEQLLSREPVPPSLHSRGCPRDLETICLKCLQKDPARRYASAEALADDLHRFLEGRPIAVRPVGSVERLWRWCRRNPAPAGLLAVLALVILGSLAGVTVLYLNAEQQRHYAEQQRQTLEQREEEARAITRFYETYVLTVPRPKGSGGGVGRDVRLKEALDRAVPKIDEAFAGRPKLEAAVRDTVGVTYWWRGEYKAAEPLLEKAYAIRLEVLGPEHPDTLTSLQNLARLRWRQGKLTEAVEKSRQAMEARKRVLGPEHENTLWSQINLGVFLSEENQFTEAEALLGQAIAVCKLTIGADHHHTLWAQRYLAWTRERQGKLAEAEKLFRETLEAQRRAPDLGPAHANTLLSQSNLARVIGERGDPAAAERLLRETLALQTNLLGPEYPNTLLTQEDLARVLLDQDRLDDAERFLDQTLAVLRRKFDPGHPDILATQNLRAILLGKQEKPDRAEQLFREVLGLRRKSLGPDHLDLASTLADLGSLLLDQGRLAEAEPLLRESLAIREKKLVPDCWWLAHTRSLFGGSLALQGKFAAAEPPLLAGYEGLVRAKGPPPKQVAWTRDRIIELYEKWGKREQAEAWRKKRSPSAPQTAP
jgi:tetratricopeptide (TPR) repeat protein/tRNA A-37 threonylcarbamoyl transferase component Bud32